MGPLLWSAIAAAQGVTLTIDAPVTTLGVGESVKVGLRFDGATRAEIQEWSSELGIALSYAGMGTTFKNVNGVISRTVQLEYCLGGEQAGTFSTLAATATVDGQPMPIPPMTFEVVAGPTAVPEGQRCTTSGGTLLAPHEPRDLTGSEARALLPTSGPDVVTGSGTQVVFLLDLSASMAAEEDGKSRLAWAKEALSTFVRRHEAARFGLIVFGQEAFTVAPPSTDRGTLLRSLEDVEIGMISDKATAMGDGLLAGIHRVENASGERVLVLLTDGRNNAGTMSPLQAADVAKALGVRVHAVALSSDGPDPSLEQVTLRTGGTFLEVHVASELAARLGSLEL